MMSEIKADPQQPVNKLQGQQMRKISCAKTAVFKVESKAPKLKSRICNPLRSTERRLHQLWTIAL